MNQYIVLSNFESIEPNFCEGIASYIKTKKYDGIILNGDLSGINYVNDAHALAKLKIKQEIKNKHRQKKKKTIIEDIEQYKLALLRLEQKSMLCKNKQFNYEAYLNSIIKTFAKTNMDVYVNRGYSDDVEEYENSLEYLTNKYKNIIDTTKNLIIQKKDHELVFIPGGLKEILIKPDKHEYDKSTPKLQLIINKIKNPESAIVFTSELPLFKTKYAVDSYEQWELQGNISFRDVTTNEKTSYEVGELIDRDTANIVRQIGGKLKPPTFKNNGNEYIREMYESNNLGKIMINMYKNITRAHNWREKQIKQGEFSDELICIPSNADKLIAGKISVIGNKIAYQAIPFSNLTKQNYN